eukprot:TRINITY_DN95333_c0_g1_i1.p1 TRINITY_DN95333_c0_g1~~TRINITY_DN95333_c0_g1_i1.p1  ORF type:complete len:186 (-),score=32.21 TRINITY_DN95333_c0_g1_i1:318-875(-)
MAFDLLPGLCVAELVLFGLVLCRSEPFLAWARTSNDQVQLARVAVAGFACLCLCWQAFRYSAGALTHDESQSGITLALVAAALAWFFGPLLQVVEDAVAAKSLRTGQVQHGDQLSALRTERDSARADSDRQKEEIRKLELKISAILKQAEGQADEYMRLMNENKSLRNQLADFDLVLGDKRKKAA